MSDNIEVHGITSGLEVKSGRHYETDIHITIHELSDSSFVFSLMNKKERLALSVSLADVISIINSLTSEFMEEGDPDED